MIIGLATSAALLSSLFSTKLLILYIYSILSYKVIAFLKIL